MKVCIHCRINQPYTEFYAGTNADGYASKCKKCCAIYYKKRTQALADGTFKVKKTVTEKKCKRCQITLPVDSFYINHRGATSTNCIQCSTNIAKARHNKNKSSTSYEEYIHKKEAKDLAELRKLMSDIECGKIKHDPIEHEEFCKKHKVSHHREWVFDYNRIKEIDDMLKKNNTNGNKHFTRNL